MIHAPLAYIGPGAGFAFLGSFLSLLLSLAASFASLLLWPFRMLWGMLRRGRGMRKASVRKLIFLGLDGLDAEFTEKLMAEGKLPNLMRLEEQGSYRRLRTTLPALSHVAWSTFATGVSPALDMKGETQRKSEPFWKILGRNAVESTILRVPTTFAPDDFDGRLLSAMATPELPGTHGRFSLFTRRAGHASFEHGRRYPLIEADGALAGELAGSEDSILFWIREPEGDPVLDIQGSSYPLRARQYTPWIRLKFGAGRSAVHGIVRFLVTQTGQEFSLYATAVQIDPEEPDRPISQPHYYAVYLAKLLGSFSTLGMAEDTWALNEGAIDEDDFLAQAQLIQAEREAMFFSALDHQRSGVVACVFDMSDRVQHMFYRYLEPAQAATRHSGVIERMYRDMDRLVGRTLDHTDKDTAVFVLSDHGFCSFRRGVNLNAWLQQNGYLALTGEEIDWRRTRAYTVGLSGLYLNVRGREAQGVVDPKDTSALMNELISRLTGLRDEDSGEIGIRNVYASTAIFRGPYPDTAPDLIVGYARGYRASWDAALGRVSPRVFEDNVKAWSGDHCVDPSLVPGVLFSNRKLDAEDPGIEDMAPTALRLFGIQPPEWMEGKPVFTLREFGCLAVICLCLLSTACGKTGIRHSRANGKQVIVIGVDGMDPAFVERHWADLPNLARMRERGTFTRLATTTPPQSPTAWSTFITGLDPAEHGIFDFVHRDPATMLPFLSMSETRDARLRIPVGPWQLPLARSQVVSLRKGKAFWQTLEDHGIPATIVHMPVNYPPVESGEGLAGMGTPDLQGTQGTFTYYTDDPGDKPRAVGGGLISRAEVVDGRAELRLKGPPDSLRRDHRASSTVLIVDVDPVQPLARVAIDDSMGIVREGEWSDWLAADFPLLPHLASVRGMVRVFAKQLHPRFEVYVSPINVDPVSPDLPISTPHSFSREISGQSGRFYTLGIPEDTSALRQGVFDLPEFLSQSHLVLDGERKLLDYSLDHFRDGLLFFYFSSVDQNSHMLWGQHDAELLNVYRAVDAAIGEVLRRKPSAEVMVMSDHGFASFDRSVDLNRWLYDERLLALKKEPNEPDEIDWARTRVYALGLNGLYLNLAGRERQGQVHRGQESQALIERVRDKLLSLRDPANGRAPIETVAVTNVTGENARIAPDLIVGYSPGYRASWQTGVGGLSSATFEDNTDAWIADHCINAADVPGVLFTTSKVQLVNPSIKDLPVSLLARFSIAPETGMTGHSIYNGSHRE